MAKEDSIKEEDDMVLFHAAMREVTPLPPINRVAPIKPLIAPISQKKICQDEQALIKDNLSEYIAKEIEAGDTWSYARAGVSHQTLRRLYRNYWRIEGDLDLHGLSSEEARKKLSSFLNVCSQKGYRCVRVIHGRGLSSKNRKPVLKIRTGNWLIQHANVLAFCQARPEYGGGGAIVILLKVGGASF